MNLELNNKYALVCGSTAGIGKATAIALAEEGAIITLIARNEEKLKAVLSELTSLNTIPATEDGGRDGNISPWILTKQ